MITETVTVTVEHWQTVRAAAAGAHCPLPSLALTVRLNLPEVLDLQYGSEAVCSLCCACAVGDTCCACAVGDTSWHAPPCVRQCHGVCELACAVCLGVCVCVCVQ